MKRLHFIAALCLSITLLVPGLSLAAKKAQSRNINFGAITCGEFLQEISQGSVEDAGVVLMWIDGYLSGVSGDTTLDWKNLEKFSTDLMVYCGNKSNAKVLDAAEAVGVSK
jgi:acid stress chaperone HdeB